MDSRSPHFPPGFEALELLARNGASVTSRGRLDGKDVVLRLSPADDSKETLAELQVLAAVHHPGIATLVAHGTVASSRQQFVARDWIVGDDFATWSRAHSAEEICTAAARLCRALTHLHESGFLHADLKPENVIVSPDGMPVLTDFGLSKKQGSDRSGTASGSWISLAPELLIGQAATVRSDVFSFGVLLFLCLSKSTPNPASLYARFPAKPFLEAAGANIEQFPESIRDLLTRCLARDPEMRPVSFLEIEQLFAGRFESCTAPPSIQHTVRWPIRTGREEWLDAWVCRASRCVSSEADKAPQELVLPHEENVSLFLEDLRLLSSLAGLSSTIVDLSILVRGACTTAEIDRLLSDLLEQAQTTCLFVSVSDSSSWSLRAQECLLRAARQHSDRILVVTGRQRSLAESDAQSEAWTQTVVPSADIATVQQYLADSLEGDNLEQLARVAQFLDQECAGSATLIDAALQGATRRGWIVEGNSRPRLRTTVTWDRSIMGPAPTSTERFGALEERLLAALAVAGTAVSWDRLQAQVETGAEELPHLMRDLLRDGLVSKQYVAGKNYFELTRAGAAAHINEQVLLEAHAQEAQRLEDLGTHSARVLPHSWASGLADERSVVAKSRELRDSGQSELAVDMLSEVLAHSSRLGRALPLVLTAELASSWMSLGQHARAETLISQLERAETDGELAAQAFLTGQLATHQRKHQQALEAFERAVALDEDHAGAALMAKARVLFESRQDELLDCFVDSLAGDPPACLGERLFANFHTMKAMSLHRRGFTDEAIATLQELYAQARVRSDPFHQAVLATNLASIARRQGKFDRSIDLFNEAEASYESAGHLPGIAQVQNLRGGVLRELGSLSEATTLLTSALAIRERLGDRRGATLTRGILAMVHADAGQLHAADMELGTCVESLEEMHPTVEARFLAALQSKVRARLGRSELPETGSDVGSVSSDPRIQLALGEAAGYRGDAGESARLLRECVDLAEQLGWPNTRDEATLALCLAANGDPAELSCSSPRVLEDIAVRSLLTSDPLDEKKARNLASQLEQRGRYGGAARIYLAIAARCSDGECHIIAQRLLEGLARGLTEIEKARLVSTLLGATDPRPNDLDTLPAYDEHDSLKDLETLLSINKRLAEQEDLRTLLGAIVESAICVTSAARGFLVLEEEGDLRFDTALDSRRGDIDYPEMKTSRSVIRQALESMEPLRLRNAAEDPNWESAQSIRELELRSVMCAPFHVDESLRGVIYVDHPELEDLFHEKAEFLLGHLAGQASVAIRQVRRHGEIQRLNAALEEAITETRSDLKCAREALRKAGHSIPTSGLIGSSPAMRKVHALLERVAPSLLPVLITGASGTGKEMAARALHSLSNRENGPFISENCASLPASLAESELFGFNKGAFTGADRDRAGMFERADGGTLFLDEIGELPLELQAKLLRVIETGELRRLGGNDLIQCDVRLVAATNRDIEQDLTEGRFRPDLYYRLNAIRVKMPLLAERVEDIPELTEYFLQRAGVVHKVSPSVFRALCEREWPGNVRELANEIARLCLMTDGDLDDPEAVLRPNSPSTGSRFGERLTLAMIERSAIEDAIGQFDGDKKRAAAYLGISRTKIYDCLARWKAEDAN